MARSCAPVTATLVHATRPRVRATHALSEVPTHALGKLGTEAEVVNGVRNVDQLRVEAVAGAVRCNDQLAGNTRCRERSLDHASLRRNLRVVLAVAVAVRATARRWQRALQAPPSRLLPHLLRKVAHRRGGSRSLVALVKHGEHQKRVLLHELAVVVVRRILVNVRALAEHADARKRLDLVLAAESPVQRRRAVDRGHAQRRISCESRRLPRVHDFRRVLVDRAKTLAVRAPRRVKVHDDHLVVCDKFRKGISRQLDGVARVSVVVEWAVSVVHVRVLLGCRRVVASV
mmetsp:Transcript_11977/g.27186  ORF Transcript_11977/g.27186 Transcript_11977/m.27186 type:complete len:288 (+) Transcript_11977:490-1353(+)